MRRQGRRCSLRRAPSWSAVEPSAPCRRLAGRRRPARRTPDAWEWPDWSYVNADGTFGNRYDDPGRALPGPLRQHRARGDVPRERRPLPGRSGVVAAEISTADDEDAPVTIAARSSPPAASPNAGWGTAELAGTFSDVGHADSLGHLRAHLASRLLHYGIDNLDAGDVRRHQVRLEARRQPHELGDRRTERAPRA